MHVRAPQDRTVRESEFFDQLRSQLKAFIQHDFTAKWQALQFKRCIANFEPGTVVIVMDFSENFTIVYPREPQSMYFNNASIAIHVMVVYRHAEVKSDGFDGGVRKEYHFFMSDDTKHDTEFVQVSVLHDVLANA